jgi:hypothetical protein
MGLTNELLAVSAAVKRVIIANSSGKIEENLARYGEKSYLSDEEIKTFAKNSTPFLTEFTKAIEPLGGASNYGIFSYRMMDIVMMKLKEKIIMIITDARKATILAENFLDRVKSYT